MIPVGFTADGSMKYTISGYFAEVFANLQVSDAALKEVISDSNNNWTDFIAGNHEFYVHSNPTS